MTCSSEPDEVASAEQMALYGISRVPADQYHYKAFRYSKLSDAIAQAKRDERQSGSLPNSVKDV